MISWLLEQYNFPQEHKLLDLIPKQVKSRILSQFHFIRLHLCSFAEIPLTEYLTQSNQPSEVWLLLIWEVTNWTTSLLKSWHIPCVR